MVIPIDVETALKIFWSEQKVLLIDTRSPKEYELDHLPGAINLPILSNEERAVVGTLYKQVSQEKAVEKGIEFFSKKLPEFIAEINKHKPKEIIIYCWRGGMRSRAVTALLESLGYKVFQLAGGYKNYRYYVREKLQSYSLKPKLVVIWGLTCTGKTKLLAKFPNSLNLEELAQHRGSLYGGIGLKPNSQKKFDNLLLQQLDKLNSEKYIVVEGESRKIGLVEIPPFLYKAMQTGMHILLIKDLNLRAKEAVDEYLSDVDNRTKDTKNNNKDNTPAITELKTITLSLKKILSRQNKDKIINLIDSQKYIDAAKILLEEYYDPLYYHTLKKIDFDLEVNNDDTNSAVKIITKKIAVLLKKFN
ncbi:MAG TPA: tRNA 2-selenouridine(34) synthase MnmH [Candidatus Nanoarchaeia archaeon]|nr:tRNA 2-selenouridine(34) synthase MnmH [Candidatus Nanoarchaeia archaeon]